MIHNGTETGWHIYCRCGAVLKFFFSSILDWNRLPSPELSHTNILHKAQLWSASAARIWLTPGGGMTVLRTQLGLNDLGCHSTPNGAISQPLIWSASLPTKICCFCTKKCAWLEVRILSGWWFMLWRSVFPEQLWFLSMSYDHTLVHVHHIMVREVSWATSQEKVCSPEWAMIKRPINTLTYTHIHTVSCMMSYNDEWGCDGLSLLSKFVHSVNNGPGSCPSFLFSLFSFFFGFPLSLQILSTQFLI